MKMRVVKPRHYELAFGVYNFCGGAFPSVNVGGLAHGDDAIA
jgi:hypothetical protein